MKKKLSITLDAGLVKRIETLASKQHINRSKFIETILIEKLETTPVLILAAWSNIRRLPKSLLSYDNKKLIVNQIESLNRYGFRNIFVTINSEELKDYLERNFPEVKIIEEREKIGSGGTLKRFAEKINKTFLFMHCDVLCQLNLRKLVEFHIKEKAGLTLALKSVRNPSKYGNATMEGNRVIDFVEKPKSTSIYLVYIGIGVAEPRAIALLENRGKFEYQLNQIKDKVGYIYEGFWKSFKTERDFSE